jgi:hypothetical protein
VVAVTPIVTGRPIGNDGEAHRARAREEQLRARGLEHSASAVAGLYAELAETFVIDRADVAETTAIEANDQLVESADTIITGDEAAEQLAKVVLTVAN